MTLENVKRLYNHYIEIGMTDKAEEMKEAYAKKRPPVMLGTPAKPEVYENVKTPAKPEVYENVKKPKRRT